MEELVGKAVGQRLCRTTLCTRVAETKLALIVTGAARRGRVHAAAVEQRAGVLLFVEGDVPRDANLAVANVAHDKAIAHLGSRVNLSSAQGLMPENTLDRTGCVVAGLVDAVLDEKCVVAASLDLLPTGVTRAALCPCIICFFFIRQTHRVDETSALVTELVGVLLAWTVFR